MFWFWFENVKWKIETKTKIHTLRLESITVPINLLLWVFLCILFLVITVRAKKYPMPKFRLSRRQFLNRLGYFLQHSAVANMITAVDISPLILKGLEKNKIYLCWVLNISFQATFWASLWIELLGSNTNITADHTAIVL